MCYQVIERYSACRCLYYQHSVDFCAAYGTDEHPIQERTVLVGYSCAEHSGVKSESKRQRQHDSKQSVSGEGAKITSAVTLLKAVAEEDTKLSKKVIESVLKANTPSSTGTREDRPRPVVPPQSTPIPSSILDDFRRRIRHPHEYITSLETAEQGAWMNSTISLYTQLPLDLCTDLAPELAEFKSKNGQTYILYPTIPPDIDNLIPTRLSDNPFISDSTNTSDDEITTICDLYGSPASGYLNLVRMCRNISIRTFLNLKFLQRSKICTSNFSVVVLDKNRTNVASLVTIENSDFAAFVFELEYVLRDSAALVLDAVDRGNPININSRCCFLESPMIQKLCTSLLQIDENLGDGSDESHPGVIETLLSLVLMLDLSVASYAGAHCSDFLAEYLPLSRKIDLLQPFSFCSDALHQSAVKLRRCKLECLDAFHSGAGIWVFCPPNVEPASRLYLSTDVAAFGDVWGPLWKWKHPTAPGIYSAYVVGNGSIFRISPTSLTPVPVPGEVLCHWMSNEEMEQNGNNQLHKQYLPFQGTERLLLGAPTESEDVCFRAWSVNKQCSISVSKVRRQLKQAGRLCIVGASRPFHYNDSDQYQLQVGYSGVNASMTRQYKRMPGRTLKEVLIELWAMVPEIRDPSLLEDLHGVEVSMCTSNAQRTPLSKILLLDCMRHLLRNFDWGDATYEKEYRLTLEDVSRARRRLDSVFRDKFDSAIMFGLNMLSKTGLTRDNFLNVFLSSACTPKPELANLTSKEHTWIGFLKDTTTECAMVAFGNTCMVCNDLSGLSCGESGTSALMTAMVLHESMSTGFNREEAFDPYAWPLSQKESTNPVKSRKVKGFSMGNRGLLTLKMCLRGTLVVVWDSTSLTSILKSKLSSAPVHLEYTEIDHTDKNNKEEGRVPKHQPIPTIVVSDNWKQAGTAAKNTLQ